MKYILVDDEPQALLDLSDTVQRVDPTARITTCGSADEVLEVLKKESFDVMFSDIEMPRYSGLRLAKAVKELQPELPIVFVTGYDSFAMMAWGLHVSGYLLKPADESDIEEVLQHLSFKLEEEPNILQVRCFGEFAVSYNGKAVQFGRKRALEVLAYLVDARGREVSSAELRGALWEGDSVEMEENRVYLRQLIYDLRQTLRGLGCEDVLNHRRDAYSINCDKISCDYYKFLQRNIAAVNSFHGEYMSQFSWADMTLGELLRD